MASLLSSTASAFTAAALLAVLLATTSASVAHAQGFRSICGPLGPPTGGSCEIRCFRADPVCGADGVTYTCGCPEASCKGVPVLYKGTCTPRPPRPSDICGGFSSGGPALGRPTCEIRCFREDPVCGVNGITYWCGCPEAACKGVRVVKEGAC